MRRIGTTLVGAALLLSACGPSSGSSGDGPGATASPGDAAERFQPVAVVGSGRATQASSTTGTDILVATTIGVNLIDAAGGATILPTTTAAPAAEAVMAPDGRHGVVSAYDRSELWSLGSAPTLLAEFAGPTSASFSVDGSTLVAATPNRLTATTLVGSEPVRTLADAPAGSQFGALTATPDATSVAAPVSGDGTIDLVTYSAAAGATFVDVFADPLTKIEGATITDDGSRVVMTTTAGDPFAGRLASWSVVTGTIDWDIDLGSSGLRTLWAVGTDGRTLLADDTALRLIGTDGAIVAEWPHDDRGTPTSITPTQGGYAITSPSAGVLFVDLDGSPRSPQVAAGSPLIDVESLSADDGIVMVDSSGRVSSWRSDGTMISESNSYRSGAINEVAVSDDGRAIASASTDGSATVTAADGTGPATALAHPEGNVDSVAFSPDGTRLLTGVGQRLSDVAFDDTVSLWNLADGTRTAQFGGEGEDVNGCANFRSSVEFSPDGSLYAAASHDFTVSIHRADSGELVSTLPPHLSTVLDVAFSPTGDRLVTSSDDGAVRVWNVADLQMLSEYVGPPGGYWSLAFMPDGDSLVVSDLTGALRRIDVTTGAEVLTFAGTTSRTGRIAVSPNGALVAAPSDGSTVGIWSTTSGELLAQMAGHAAPVTSAAFSPDGSRLYTGSGDATVRIWQIA